MTTEERFIAASQHRIERSWLRIHHAMSQLSDEDLWWRPNPEMNSAGNLILHLAGNLRQWIVSGVGGSKDVRKRQAEFDERGPVSRAELSRRLEEVKADMDSTWKDFDPSRLNEAVRIQGFDLTYLDAIYGALTHLEGHTGQLVYIARMRAGERYELFWKPESPEQVS